MSENPKTKEVPSIASGKALFEAGCTIQNAARFLEMNLDKANMLDNEWGPSSEPDELAAYFEWEIESMTLYMRSRLQLPGAWCVVCGSLDAATRGETTAWGIVAPYPPTDAYRCVSCGRHYSDHMGRLEIKSS